MASCGSPSGGQATPRPDFSDWDAGGEYPHPYLEDHGESVSITFPEEMFEGVELSAGFIEVNEYIDAYANSDGSVVVTMTKARQKQFLDAFKSDVDGNAAVFIPAIDYLHDVVHSEDMRNMAIFVDGKTNRQELYELPYFFSLPMEQYQQMLGWEVRSTITVYDEKTNEEIFTLVFPDDEQ
jgi:hypothetical protein